MHEAISIGIVGNGITGRLTAVELGSHFGEQANITMYDNFSHPLPVNRPVAPSHLGPIGLEVQSGSLWNGYTFEESDGGLYCNVSDGVSKKWLEEFSRRSNDVGVVDRQLDLYLHNREGLDYYLTDPLYANHIAQNGNLRLFRSAQSFRRAVDYVRRIQDIYQQPPEVIDEDILQSRMPGKRGSFRLNDYAGGIFYPEDATGDSLKIQEVMSRKLGDLAVRVLNQKIVEVQEHGNGATITTRSNKKYSHDIVYVCAGIENEAIAGVDKQDYWLYPFAGRRFDFTQLDQMDLQNITIGLDDECFILRQATDGSIQAGGTVIIRDREKSKDRLFTGDEKDDFLEKSLSRLFGKEVKTVTTSYGIRAMTQDDLPRISSSTNNSIVLINPTGHLGFLQAPVMASHALSHAVDVYDYKKIAHSKVMTNEALRAETRRLYRQKGPKTHISSEEDKPTPRRGSRSNFVALRRSIIESGRGNSKKPMSREQKLARRRKK